MDDSNTPKNLLRGLSTRASIAFAANCARRALNEYVGDDKQVMEIAIAAAENYDGNLESLPSSKELNKVLKITKARFEVSKHPKDAAKAYLAYAAYSALRCPKVSDSYAEAYSSMTAATKALSYWNEARIPQLLADLKFIVQYDQKSKSTLQSYPASLFDQH